MRMLNLRRSALLLGCALLGLSGLSPALAAATRGIELTPFVGQRFGGEFSDRNTGADYELNDSSAYGLVFGFPWENNTQFEAYYSHQDTDLDAAGFQSNGNPVAFDLDTLQIGGTYFFPQRGRVLPFFVATAGGTRIKPAAPGTKSDTFLSFGIGGGWKFYPADRIGLRLEGRFLGTLIDSNSEVFCGVSNGSGSCLINTSGDILWQFEAQAGVIFRF